jgi:hypothetical protein
MSVTEVNDRVFEFVGENASRFLELRTASVSLNKKFSAGITLFTWKLNVFQTWSTVVAWWKVKRRERWWCGPGEQGEVDPYAQVDEVATHADEFDELDEAHDSDEMSDGVFGQELRAVAWRGDRSQSPSSRRGRSSGVYRAHAEVCCAEAEDSSATTTLTG